MTIPTTDTHPVSPPIAPDEPLPMWRHHGPTSLRASDPDNPTRNDTTSAGQVFVVMMGALLIGAVLNAEAMVQRASTQELGWSRDLSLMVWEPVESVASALGLTAPRSVLDKLTDQANQDSGFSTDRFDHRANEDTWLTPDSDEHRDDILAPSKHPTTSSSLPVANAAESTSGPAPQTEASLGEAEPVAAEADPAASPAPVSTDGRIHPTPESPLRLLIVGDSTMDGVGAALMRNVTATGKVEAQLNYRISTGLSRPDFYDWPQYLYQTTNEFGIDVVIIMLGANDAQPFLVNDEPVGYGTELWFGTYRARVAELMSQLAIQGVGVVWVGQAPMKDETFDAKMVVLNQIYQSEAERAGASVIYLDPRPVMGENGSYAPYLANHAGEQVKVRRNDGVHFTPEGGDRLAPFIIQGMSQLVALDP